MKNSFYILVFILVLVGFLVDAQAQNDDPFSELTYPIPELGDCQSREACEVYCDASENMETCLDFAEAHALLPEEEIEMGRKMLALGLTEGPGGCEGQEECEAYCDEIEHIKECILFAEENNLIPPDELEEAKKVVQAIDKGLVPPKCKGKRECDVYCSKPENMEECIAFGEAAGLIPPGEMAEAKKMLEAIRKGVKPPDCAGKKECDIYCSQPENMEECMTFAIAAGFMPPEEIENARKTLEALKQGISLPDCRGEEECNIYCSQPEHMEECMTFAIAAGFMPPEEIENARKTLEAIRGGVMPPNCRGEEECNTYCSQPEHMEECINFSEAAGFMTSEDAAKARKMAELGIVGGPGGCQGEEECEAFCQDPANMETCINYSVMMGDMTQEEAEEALQYKEVMEEGEEFGPGMMPPEGFEGEFEGEMFEGEMPEGMMPEEFEEQFNQEFERQYQEQYQQQYQQQMEQQIQQFSPPPIETAPPPSEFLESPQSFFDLIKIFLAGLVPKI